MRSGGRGVPRRQRGGRARGLRDRADRARALSFICLIEIELHFPEGGSLKAKRKELVSVKEQLRRRFGASVAETAHHELWQRATLTAALVGRDALVVEEAAAGLERHVVARFGEGARCERALRSSEDVLG